MVDVKFSKLFKDANMNDVYVVSIKVGEKYFNLNLTKEEFDKVYQRLQSIYENGGLN